MRSDGKPATDQIIVLSVDEDTTGGTLFVADGKNFAVLHTDAEGLVTVPALKAGGKAGGFVLRATGYDAQREVTVKFAGTVTPAVVDLLVRSDADAGKAVVTVTGTPVKGIEFLATAKAKPAAGAKATAGVGTKDADGKWVPADPAAAGATPYFLDKEGRKLTELELPATAADGKIALPDLATTGVAAGKYTLRVRISEKVELFLEITVTEAPKA
ncbi:hypothetical protein [Streptomyces sp. ICC1]|uniref:hypothetical protein n=1 Tax=Streptomyces sp. ICC1 TaxID=2099583 RepID=UPI000DC7D78D|nr:hypothetical protein [Streptomyces sp. ICC1]AWZ09179.1 hypothetical protein DRB89_36980 [Streptomyces sp. ICC4]AWZ15952.1 hypothetical protein DRB96_31040 [Streptomyces sp. ICC1]